MLTNKRPFDDASPEEVYRKMEEGYQYPYDCVLPRRPEILYDLMKRALSPIQSDRPAFFDVKEKLKPICDKNVAFTSNDVLEFRKGYDGYKTAKREMTARRQASLDSSSSSTVPVQAARLTSLNESSSMQVEDESDEEEDVGQIVSSSATAAPARTNPDYSQHKKVNSVPTSTKTPQTSQPKTNDQMEIEQTQVVANSYEEAAQNQVKTTPFESPPSNPRPVQVSASAPVTSQAVYNIQGNNINLLVGDIESSANASGAPQANHPNLTPPIIPALNSPRIMTRADMYIVIEKVGKKWKWMAREMISDGQIESIDYDYEKDGLNEKIYQVLRLWQLKNNGQCTMGELVAKLKDANFSGVAAALPP